MALSSEPVVAYLKRNQWWMLPQGIKKIKEV
jgi:hypothetical protein